MKILQYNDSFDFTGGAEKYYMELTEDLIKHNIYVYRTGLTTKDYLPNTLKNYEFPIKVSPYKWHLPFNYKVYKKFKKILFDVKPDIVHIHNNYHSPASILKALNEYNCPIVQTVHDYGLLCPSSWGVYKDNYKICSNFGFTMDCIKHKCLHPLSFIREFIKRKILVYKYRNIVNAYISPSKHLAYNISKKYPNKKVYILRNFLDLGEYPYVGYDNYSKEELLYVGALEKHKGIFQLIKTLKYVVGKYPNVVLNIAGKGKEENNLKNLVKSLNLEKNVKFLGFIPNNKIKELYSKSHFIIMPSIWLENSPFVIYESMAIGKYVLGSDRGGCYELITESDCGSVVNVLDYKKFANEITRVLELDENELIKKSKNGRKFAEKKFDKEKHIEELIEIYGKSL